MKAERELRAPASQGLRGFRAAVPENRELQEQVRATSSAAVRIVGLTTESGAEGVGSQDLRYTFMLAAELLPRYSQSR